MTILLIVVAIIYTVVTAVVAGHHLMDWSFYRDVDDLTQARAAARGFTRSPLWPLLALGALVRIYADSKENP